MNKLKSAKNTDDLFLAILGLENIKEARAFFRDLCTVAEIKDMSERWQIVKLLDQGKTYREIAKKLKASTTTVSRVASWLNNGTNGYRLVLNKSSHHNPAQAFEKG